MQVNRCFGCMEETTSSPCQYCGYTPRKEESQSYALQPGTILHGKYLIGKVLGQGGFGITYIGWDLALSRKVAIKEYFPSAHVSRDSDVSTVLQWYSTKPSQEAYAMGKEIFLKEARKMNRVESIPQVVHIQEIFDDNDTAYIVMNYIPGETLAKKIKKTGPMSWKNVQELLLPVADVLKRVHNAGLIHRDLSPDNLMIQPDGSVKILDLGASKDLNLNSGASSMQVAKGGFSPMEQYIRKGNSGPWTDVYSMAATMYFALTGVVPPSAVDRMDKDTLRWDLPQLNKVPAAVIHVLQKAMAMQAKDRIQTMDAFADAIRKAAQTRNTKKFLPVAASVFVVAIALVAILAGAKAGTKNKAEEPGSAEPAVSMEETNPKTDGAQEQEADVPWINNVLVSTVIPEAYAYDMDMAPVFNSRICRYQIISVTFLDSLESVGAGSWDVSQNRDGSVMAWTQKNGTVSNWIDSKTVESEGYDLYIAADGGINGKYCAHLFEGFNSLQMINFNGCFHTDYAESMEEMFSGCSSLATLDVSGLKTGNVRNMYGLFSNCGVTSLDVSHFDTSNVENMGWMFYSCSKLTSLDLRNFDTSKVTDMGDMFCLTGKLTSLDISSFDTSSVTDMSFMFSYTEAVNLDLTHFDTSKVTTISYMFSGCDRLETLDIQGWDTSKVTSMNGVFSDCSKLKTILGITSLDTSSVTSHKDFMDEGVKIDGKPWEDLFK